MTTYSVYSDDAGAVSSPTVLAPDDNIHVDVGLFTYYIYIEKGELVVSCSNRKGTRQVHLGAHFDNGRVIIDKVDMVNK